MTNVPNIATVVDRLNSAVRRDWKAIHNLVESRVLTNNQMADHESIIVVPNEGAQGTQFLLGLLGIINGIARETNDDPPIEALFSDDHHELIAFKLRGDETPVVDQRAVHAADLQEGRAYRVTDRVGTRWEGQYTGAGQPGGEQGIHLRMTDGTTALIYFHDAAQIIYA